MHSSKFSGSGIYCVKFHVNVLWSSIIHFLCDMGGHPVIRKGSVIFMRWYSFPPGPAR